MPYQRPFTSILLLHERFRTWDTYCHCKRHGELVSISISFSPVLVLRLPRSRGFPQSDAPGACSGSEWIMSPKVRTPAHQNTNCDVPKYRPRHLPSPTIHSSPAAGASCSRLVRDRQTPRHVHRHQRNLVSVQGARDCYFLPITIRGLAGRLC